MTSPDAVVPLDRVRLLSALTGRRPADGRQQDGGDLHDLLSGCLTVVTSTGSTNADVSAAARAGAPEWTVVVAAEQRQGRGRLRRPWSSPSGSVSMSVLLRPSPPVATWGWLPLLAGVAVVAALRSVTTDATPARVRLKWPNDVVVGSDDGDVADVGSAGRKLAGILVEQVSDPTPAAVVGVGINVATDAARLAVPTATTLLLATGRAPEREQVAAAVLAELVERYDGWCGCSGDADRCGLRDEYVAMCATLGRRVRLELPRGDRQGEAVGIDSSGRLLVVDDGGGGATTPYSSGEVVHLR